MRLPDWLDELLKEAELKKPEQICITVQKKLKPALEEIVRRTRETGREHGFSICVKDGPDWEVVAGRIIKGTAHSVNTGFSECPCGYRKVGDVHTHLREATPSTTDLLGWPNIGCILAARTSRGLCFTNAVDDDSYALARDIMELNYLIEELLSDAAKFKEVLDEAVEKYYQLNIAKIEFLSKYACQFRLDWGVSDGGGRVQ